MGTILATRGLTKNFGGLSAVSDFDLSVEQGEIRAIIGPNGAGKTTLFNCMTGFYRPDAGKVLFKGVDITGLPPHRISKMNISRTFQLTNIFLRSTVYENIRVARQSRMKGFGLFSTSVPAYEEEAANILRKIGLYDRKDELACNLSHGEQRHLEIGIALATSPELLMLDEPTAGMNPTEVKETVNTIREVAKTLGVTVLLIEHDMRVVMDISDMITVMHLGKKIAEGKPEEVRKNAEVVRVYFGG